MKTTRILYDAFGTVGHLELSEEVRYDKDVKLTRYIFKNHLWYSFVTHLGWIQEGSLYMTVDGKLIFSAILENGKATVYLVRNGERYEYRTFKVK